MSDSDGLVEVSDEQREEWAAQLATWTPERGVARSVRILAMAVVAGDQTENDRKFIHSCESDLAEALIRWMQHELEQFAQGVLDGYRRETNRLADG